MREAYYALRKLNNMKDYGWDIKHQLWLVLAIFVSYPVLTFEPLIILFLIAAILFIIGTKQIIKSRSLGNWMEITGSLLKTDIGVFRVSFGKYSSPVKHYYPLAYYSYNYNGAHYKSNQYAFDHKSIWSTEQELVEKVIKELESNETINVFVNPNNPKEAVLNRQVSANRLSHYWALLASGCILFVIGIFLSIYS